jgi:hypothetical protein
LKTGNNNTLKTISHWQNFKLGLAAAFNAPLAGMIFALEEVHVSKALVVLRL